MTPIGTRTGAALSRDSRLSVAGLCDLRGWWDQWAVRCRHRCGSMDKKARYNVLFGPSITPVTLLAVALVTGVP